MKSYWFPQAICVGMLLCSATVARAEHARIDLTVSSQGKEAKASADEDPPAGGRNEPPVLKVQVNKPLVLQFIFTNIYPHRVIPGVTVRYYVVRAAKLGRKPAPMFREAAGPGAVTKPELEPGVVIKGQFDMEFKPDCRAGTQVRFHISEPGIYSARVESVNTQSDHEHFAAIDIVAE